MDTTIQLPKGAAIFGAGNTPMPMVERKKDVAGFRHRDNLDAATLARADRFFANAREARAIEIAHSETLSDAHKFGTVTPELEAAGRRKMQRAGNAMACVHAVRNWLDAPHYGSFVPAEMPSVTYSRAALDTARQSVDQIRDTISAVQIAPIAASERKASLIKQIEHYATIGRPNMTPDGMALMPVGGDALLPFACWFLGAKAMAARIDELVGPERDGEMTREDKEKRLADLRIQLAEAERLEVALVDASEGEATYRSTISVPSLLLLKAA